MKFNIILKGETLAAIDITYKDMKNIDELRFDGERATVFIGGVDVPCVVVEAGYDDWDAWEWMDLV